MACDTNERFEYCLNEFDRICDGWRLSCVQKKILLQSDPELIQAMRSIFKINWCLSRLFNESDASNWIHQDHSGFNNAPPIKAMINDQYGIARIKKYLIKEVDERFFRL